MNTKEVKTKSVVMPISLAIWFEDLAKKNYRDFSKEVVKILEEKKVEIEQSTCTKN
ncbi:hypothetical protein D3C75_1091450 [compost metagenome]